MSTEVPKVDENDCGKSDIKPFRLESASKGRQDSGLSLMG